VTDELWAAIEPLLPLEPRKPKGGRPRCDNRAVLAGVIFVLRSGIPWEMLPRELGCSGMTCWRRLHDWQEAGVWARLHRVLLERLGDAGHLDWSRASLDSASVPAKKAVPRPAALLYKSAEGRGSPFPGQIYPTTSVTGAPSAVKPFRMATRTWNSAT
jgi:transposase